MDQTSSVSFGGRTFSTGSARGQKREPGSESAVVLPFPRPDAPIVAHDGPSLERFSLESDRYGFSRASVALQWQGRTHTGESGKGRSQERRVELVTHAALEAVSSILHSSPGRTQSLRLHGVKEINAFGRCYVLVAVLAVRDRETRASSGVAPVEDSREAAAIAATLQATDRWIRGLV